MSKIACSSVVIVHPSRLFSRVLAGIVTNASLKLEYVSTDIQGIPFEKISVPSLFIVGGRTPGRLVDNVRNIKECLCCSRIVAIGGTVEPHVVLMALEAGAAGYLHEETPSDTLMMALELVLRGETVLPSVVLSLLAGYVAPKSQANAPRRNGTELPISAEEIKRNDPTLSTRQTAILQALIDGTPNKVIAQQLKVSEATVKLHVKAVLRKIDVRNRTQAAVWAVKQASNGLLKNSEAPRREPAK
jgi:two-component system nitrate/nitrite response regulator NarL